MEYTRTLTYVQALALDALPLPDSTLKGVIVRLKSDNKPYWCTGTVWIDLTAGGSGGSGGGGNVYIQSEQPQGISGPYIWVQTGSNGLTFWVEDGL